MNKRTYLASLMLVAALSFLALAGFAQNASTAKPQTAAERQSNVYDCGNGWTSCDPSKLTEAEVKEVAIARHARNLEDCKSGYDSCDGSKLSWIESAAVNRAVREHNVENCTQGWSSCDATRLTASEAGVLLRRGPQSCGPGARADR